MVEAQQQAILKLVDEGPGELRIAREGVESRASRDVPVELGILTQQSNDGAALDDGSLWISFFGFGGKVAADLTPEGSGVAEEDQIWLGLQDLFEARQTEGIDDAVGLLLGQRGMKCDRQAEFLQRAEQRHHFRIIKREACCEFAKTFEAGILVL